MRIISGLARNTKLEYPLGESSRVTLERVKENFFNAIHFALPGARVLDLFAGSGQLGLEAVSRGASEAVLVDRSSECAEIIKRNVKAARFTDRCAVYTYDYAEYLNTQRRRTDGRRFDIVFLDPPYDADLISGAAERLVRFALLAPSALIICESEQKELDFPENVRAAIEGTRVYKYGKVYVHALEMNG